MKSKIYLILFLFFITCFAMAQDQSVKLIAKSDGKVILLRWAPSSAMVWKAGNEWGYVLERYAVSKNTKGSSASKKIVLSTPVFKPVPLRQWQSDAEINDFSAIAAEVIYGKKLELSSTGKNSGALEIISKTKEQDQRFSMALFAADHSFKTAQLSGLAFKDSTVNENEKYFYKIFISRGLDQPVDSGMVFIGLRDSTSSPSIDGLRVEFKDKSSIIRWPREINEQLYSGFIIERSPEKENIFKSISDLPFVGFPNPADKDFIIMDSLPDNTKTYSYRIRGISAFGEKGTPSAIVSGRGIKTFKTRAVIAEAREAKNLTVSITWNISGEEKEIRGFDVERSFSEGGKYEKVNKVQPLSAKDRSFLDASPLSTNYYRLRTIGEEGESYSMPYLVQLADSISPIAPEKLNFKIDSSGVVSLYWKSNTEKDLLGYRIFRSNFKSAEFSQITRTSIQSSAYVDTISLKSLTSKVYYKIAAEDTHHNVSGFSEVIEIVKPDFIPPVPPTIKYVKSKEGEVEIAWTESASDDVAKYTLQRKDGNLNAWRSVKVFTTKDSLKYVDKIQSSELKYFYSVLVNDKFGNQSVSNSVVVKIPPVIEKKRIDELSYEVDRREKIIRLKWDYAMLGVKKYLVYRSVESDLITLYQTLESDVMTYEDKKLSLNTTYSYRLKVVFENGTESLFSKEIKIKF